VVEAFICQQASRRPAREPTPKSRLYRCTLRPAWPCICLRRNPITMRAHSPFRASSHVRRRAPACSRVAADRAATTSRRDTIKGSFVFSAFQRFQNCAGFELNRSMSRAARFRARTGFDAAFVCCVRMSVFQINFFVRSLCSRKR